MTPMRFPLALLFLSLSATSAFAATPAASFPRGSGAHIVASPETDLDRRLLDRLSAYLQAVLGQPAQVVAALDAVPEQTPAIAIEEAEGGADQHPEAFTLRTETRRGHPVVIASGATDRGRKRAIQRLILLGEQQPDALAFAELNLSERPWIPHREWTICPWTPHDVRGAFFNPFADKRQNILLYGDERLAKYVEMFDWFGYSGSQLMEVAYTYGQFGSIEAAQDWQRRVLRFLRENGQEATVWAWTAEFSGFGWTDPDAVYAPKEGVRAIDDPAVRATFERYYRRYADLAPDIDRFIAHFFDPGRLEKHSDVFDYMRLLESMLREMNPDIQMGIDCWATGPDYFTALVENGFGHYLLLPVALPISYPGDTRQALFRKAHELNLRLGIWGWYITEYESDQLTSMYVNPSVIQDVYTDIRASAEIHPIEYWSEMEANHLVNIYSMYVASRLLWDPDRDPHAVLTEFVNAVWGPANGPKVLDALRLIEDTRSGPTWETYWWTSPEHRVGTEDPTSDLQRADAAIQALSAMQDDAAYTSKFPLPYERPVFIELMLPHLQQIRHYAQFRLDTAALRQAAEQGRPKEDLARMLQEAWKPVPEYNTWIGVFGNKELRAQKETVLKLVEEFGLPLPVDPALRYREADRQLQFFRRVQGQSGEPAMLTPKTDPGTFWPEQFRLDRFQKLVEDGALREVSPGQYHLPDWENWALRR